jgi:orotate phosphoribosyltransferase
MQNYQREFIQFALDQGVLKFGSYTLKSGRVSPYFYNAGLFKTGEALSLLGTFYAKALMGSQQPVDVLFGPAYKGIPLVAATAISLYRDFDINVPWVFNRKEAKTHGEGGQLVGAALGEKTVIIDDVITAGTAIREVITLFEQTPDAHISAVLVALDRQEKGQGELSAIQELEQQYGLPVISIITLTDLLAYIKDDVSLQKHAAAIAQYRDDFGITTTP